MERYNQAATAANINTQTFGSLDDIRDAMAYARAAMPAIPKLPTSPFGELDPARPMLGLPPSIRIIEAPYLSDWQQVKFPRSKKRRIRKKWRRRGENWAHVPKTEGYFAPGMDAVVIHPAMVDRFVDAVNAAMGKAHQANLVGRLMKFDMPPIEFDIVFMRRPPDETARRRRSSQRRVCG